MRATAFAMLLALALSSSGCGSLSQGHVSAVDIDLRTPEQILAEKAQAQAVAIEHVSWVDFVVKVILIINGRIRILSVEWDVKQ